jgi:hypothetical protein
MTSKRECAAPDKRTDSTLLSGLSTDLARMIEQSLPHLAGSRRPRLWNPRSRARPRPVACPHIRPIPASDSARPWTLSMLSNVQRTAPPGDPRPVAGRRAGFRGEVGAGHRPAVAPPPLRAMLDGHLAADHRPTRGRGAGCRGERPWRHARGLRGEQRRSGRTNPRRRRAAPYRARQPGARGRACPAGFAAQQPGSGRVLHRSVGVGQVDASAGARRQAAGAIGTCDDAARRRRRTPASVGRARLQPGRPRSQTSASAFAGTEAVIDVAVGTPGAGLGRWDVGALLCRRGVLRLGNAWQ